MTIRSLSNFLQGGSGYAKRITFEEINLVNVKNPIIIDQHYHKNLELVRISFYMFIDYISCHLNNSYT
jgi:hypothetical protein